MPDDDPYKVKNSNDSDSMSNFLKASRGKSGSERSKRMSNSNSSSGKQVVTTNEKSHKDSDSAELIKLCSPRLSDSGS